MTKQALVHHLIGLTEEERAEVAALEAALIIAKAEVSRLSGIRHKLIMRGKQRHLRNGHSFGGHDPSDFRVLHGHAGKPEYIAWCAMRKRCSNPGHPAYKHYGARGISVCDRWESDFPAFLADMGERTSPKHSLDRIDNDGNYEPGNCRWATKAEQMANRRNSRKGK